MFVCAFHSMSCLLESFTRPGHWDSMLPLLMCLFLRPNWFAARRALVGTASPDPSCCGTQITRTNKSRSERLSMPQTI